MLYLLLIVISLVLGLGAQAAIRSTYSKYSRVPVSNGMTGAEAARRMLDSCGLQNVAIYQLNTDDLADHYDPTKNTLSLSRSVYSGRSVAATAVACHEAGHAVQHAQHYMPARIRMALVPVTQLAGNLWMIVFIMGLFLNMMGFIYLAIALFAFALLFQLVTLPVEFDASRRGLAFIQGYPSRPQSELEGASKVLRAAAFTYVSAALVSVVQLLYMVGLARR